MEQKQTTDPNFKEPTSYNVQIAWSERQQNNKWSAKKLSSTSLEFYNPNPPSRQVDMPDGYKFDKSNLIVRSRIDEYNNLYIILFFPMMSRYSPYIIKAFRFNGCNNDPEPLDDLSWEFLSLLEALTGTYTHGEFLMEVARDMDTSPLYLPAPSDSSTLALTPGNFYLLPPHDGSRAQLSCFFLHG